jgi:hypothetical protein
MTAEHVLQTCPTYGDLRKETWPTPTTQLVKLLGNLTDLQATAAFIRKTGLDI